jgi:hypothetical protein
MFAMFVNEKDSKVKSKLTNDDGCDIDGHKVTIPHILYIPLFQVS